MAALFKQLKRLQGRAEVAVAVPYEITCDCGTKVTGMRRSSWIEAECPVCFQSLFVLPANAYPATPSVPSEVLGGTFSERLKFVLAELFPPRSKPEAQTLEAAAQPAATAAAAAADSADTPPVRRFRWPVINVTGLLKRTFTPFRLLMLAVVAVVGLTMSWMSWQTSVESARQVWLKTPEQAEQLLQNSDLIQLERVLQQAMQAAQVLQKDGSEFRRLRNLLDETIAVNSLSNTDLLSAFHNAYDDSGRIKDNAQATVEAACQRGPFIFDSLLQKKPGLADDFLIDFPATPGQHPVQLQIPLPAIQELLEFTGDGRAIFAVEFHSVRAPEPDSFEPWVLRVQPTSFALFTSPAHCAAVGIVSEYDPTLISILRRQQEFVEGSETWHSRAAVLADQPAAAAELEIISEGK